MNLIDGDHHIVDIELQRCTSFEENYKKKGESDEGSVEEILRRKNVFMINRRKSNSSSIIQKTRLILKPLDILQLLSEIRSVCPIDVQKNINMFIKETTNVEAVFFLFPFNHTKKIFASIISDQRLEKMMEIPIEDATFRNCVSKNTPFSGHDISDHIWSIIARSSKLSGKTLLGVPFDYSPFKSYKLTTDSLILCLLNKEFAKGGNRDFSGSDLPHVTDLLAYLGPIILSAVSSMDTDREKRFRDLMNTAHKLLDFTNDIDEYMKVLMRTTRALFNAERSVLAFIDKSKSFLIGNIATTNGDDEVVQGIKVPSDHGILGRVYLTKEFDHSSDTQRNIHHCKKIDHLLKSTTSNSLTCPITFKERVYGVLELQNSAKGFTPVDQEMIKIVLCLCVIGIHLGFKWST